MNLLDYLPLPGPCLVNPNRATCRICGEVIAHTVGGEDELVHLSMYHSDHVTNQVMPHVTVGKLVYVHIDQIALEHQRLQKLMRPVRIM